MSLVDCHSHAYPAWVQDAFHAWMRETGSTAEGPSSLWASSAFASPEHHLRSMTGAGIDTAVLTFTSNAIAAMHAAAVRSLVRRSGAETIRLVNDELRGWSGTTGGRLLSTRWVDPRLVDSAMAEIERTVTDGGVPAISMHTAYQDRSGQLSFLDDPRFRPVLEAAQAADVTVFVHSSAKLRIGTGDGQDPRTDACLTGGLGMLVENTACIVRMILSGTFERLPGLRTVFGQLGGVLPFVMGRFDMLREILTPVGEDAARAAAALPRLRDHADQIYLDTHSMDLSALECALDAVGPQRIVFGSDYPVTPGNVGRSRPLRQIRQATLGCDEIHDIESRTASRLLSLPDVQARVPARKVAA